MDVHFDVSVLVLFNYVFSALKEFLKYWPEKYFVILVLFKP